MFRKVFTPLFFFSSALFAETTDNPITDGNDAYLRGDYVKAIEFYREAANDGRWPELQAVAQDYLGRMFYRGNGVTQNATEALRWFEKSAALGNAEAPSDIGDVYFFGTGVPRDLTKGVQWYQKGADKGSLHGMGQLAWCYLNGMGVSMNLDAARGLYHTAAEHSDVVSEYQYAWIFEHKTPINYSEAMTWYLKAAAQNYPAAENNIGNMYERGLGVKKDYASAAHWYEQAASAGNRRGQYHLGFLYEQGLGVAKSLEKATALMRASALAGNADARQWLENRRIGISP